MSLWYSFVQDLPSLAPHYVLKPGALLAVPRGGLDKILKLLCMYHRLAVVVPKLDFSSLIFHNRHFGSSRFPLPSINGDSDDAICDN